MPDPNEEEKKERYPPTTRIPNDPPREFSPSAAQHDYRALQSRYHTISQKSKSIQLVGTIFTIITLVIELLIYRLAKRVGQISDRIQIVRFFGIFGILFFISIIAFIQLVVISRWNHQTSDRGSGNLTQAHYRIISQISLIRILLLITLVLILTFFYIYRNYIYFPPNSPYPVLFRIYRSLLRISALLCFIYAVFEIGQLITWTKRQNKIKKIENQIAQEIPGLDELSRLLE